MFIVYTPYFTVCLKGVLVKNELQSGLKSSSKMFYAEKLVSYSENSNNYYSQDRSSIPSKILLMTWLFKKRNESVSCSCNWCQIQLGISACVMSSEYVMRTSLYLDRLKIFEWVKYLRRPLHQIQENWAVRNFLTASYVNSRSLGVQEYRDESEIYKDQWIQLSNNKFINEILGGTLDLAWL